MNSDFQAVKVGRTRVEVTPLSFGAAALGNLYSAVTDADAEATVDAAWSAGIRYFDTAPHYGLGLSERRLGQALRGRPRAEYTVSTKVGRILEPADEAGDDLRNGFAVPLTHRRRWDFSAEGVMRSVTESLDRLDMDHVDIVYLHDPDRHLEQALDEAYPRLEQLRSEGLVGAIGVGMNQTEALTRFVRDTDIDIVLLAGRYTLLDQRGSEQLLPAARERGVSVVIGGALNSGLLAAPGPDARFDYGEVPQEILAEARRLEEICLANDIPLRAAAFQFPSAHPAVASVLIGARSAAEVEDAVEMAGVQIPRTVWDEMREAGLLAPDVPTPS